MLVKKFAPIPINAYFKFSCDKLLYVKPDPYPALAISWLRETVLQ